MVDGDLVVKPYQVEYNGLLIGCDTRYHLQLISGLTGYPALRSGTVDRLGRHGGSGGRHYAPHREFYIKFDAAYAQGDESQFGLDRFIIGATFKPRVDPEDEKPLTFWLPGAIAGKLQIMCRPVDFNLSVDDQFNLMNPQYNIRFEASDPTATTFTTFTSTVNLTPDTTGLVFPLVFPLDFGASTNNDMIYTIFGTADSHWHMTITGQVSGPRIEQLSTGKILNMPNLEIESGHTLEIDSRDRTVLLDGVGNRRGDLTSASSWFMLETGAINQGIRYSSNGGTSGSTATLTYHWTYWEGS